jgi:hypothetical protein
MPSKKDDAAVVADESDLGKHDANRSGGQRHESASGAHEKGPASIL